MLSCDHTDAFNVTHGTVPPALLVCLPCRGWEPGDAEVEEATLVVQLLAELAPARHLLSAAPQLQEAVYRLASRFLCLSAKSVSPLVARLQAAREAGAGRLPPREERTHFKCVGVFNWGCG